MPERKLICELPNRNGNPDETCDGVVAHIVSPRMIQIGRKGNQRFSFVISGNGTAAITCPWCGRIHSLIWRDGQLVEKDHKFEDVEAKPEGDPADPNNPNNPGQVAPIQPETPPAE